LTLDKILEFLRDKKISISDTIISCERETTTSLDNHLIPIELNKKIIDDIKNSKINEILFTSGFGKNNAFRLFFVVILGLKITKEIKEARELTLDKLILGRPIKLTILYSPSGSSNVGLSKSKLYLASQIRYNKSKRLVHDFKVDYYRKKFE
jgi:hypothetical protein